MSFTDNSFVTNACSQYHQLKVNLEVHLQFKMKSISHRIFRPEPLPPMEVPTHQTLQSFFVQFVIVQYYAQQLNLVDEHLIDLSDYFEDQGLHQATPLINHMRNEVRQLKAHLEFLSSIKLLQACRSLQQYLHRYGRLPHLDM